MSELLFAILCIAITCSVANRAMLGPLKSYAKQSINCIFLGSILFMFGVRNEWVIGGLFLLAFVIFALVEITHFTWEFRRRWNQNRSS